MFMLGGVVVMQRCLRLHSLLHYFIIQINDYELAYIHGVIRYPSAVGTSGIITPPPEPLSDNGDAPDGGDSGALALATATTIMTTTSDIPSLDLLPPSDRWTAQQHSALVVGDPKLTELKRQLLVENVPSDFDKGALIVGEQREIRVQKVGQLCVCVCASVRVV